MPETTGWKPVPPNHEFEKRQASLPGTFQKRIARQTTPGATPKSIRFDAKKSRVSFSFNFHAF
jgi:hypothetical protein